MPSQGAGASTLGVANTGRPRRWQTYQQPDVPSGRNGAQRLQHTATPPHHYHKHFVYKFQGPGRPSRLLHPRERPGSSGGCERGAARSRRRRARSCKGRPGTVWAWVAAPRPGPRRQREPPAPAAFTAATRVRLLGALGPRVWFMRVPLGARQGAKARGRAQGARAARRRQDIPGGSAMGAHRNGGAQLRNKKDGFRRTRGRGRRRAHHAQVGDSAGPRRSTDSTGSSNKDRSPGHAVKACRAAAAARRSGLTKRSSVARGALCIVLFSLRAARVVSLGPRAPLPSHSARRLVVFCAPRRAGRRANACSN